MFFPFWGDFLLDCTENLEKREKHPLEKIEKDQVETAPQNCRFLPLVVVERVLTNIITKLILPEFSPVTGRKPQIS